MAKIIDDYQFEIIRILHERMDLKIKLWHEINQF